MKSHEVIKTIVEALQDNESMTKSIFGNVIVSAARECYMKIVTVAEIKPLIDSASYLIEQIEKLNDTINTCEHSECIQAAERQKAKYMESLTKIIHELC